MKKPLLILAVALFVLSISSGAFAQLTESFEEHEVLEDQDQRGGEQRGILTVECNPPTAKVIIDSKEFACKTPIELVSGTHRVTVVDEGFKPFERNVTISALDERQISVQLIAIEAELVEDEVVAIAPPPPAVVPLRPLGLGLMALGATLVGTSVWIDSATTERQSAIVEASAVGNRARVDELEDEAGSRRTQTLALFATGSVLFAAGATSFVIGSFGDSTAEQAPTLALTATPSKLGLRLDW
ncbi:MAG: PEGA domain-containing protein [Bradymonadaceae bacterium]|nr:PEGA domain-containing protein [Lujinxingiaceae bacterium]